MKLFCTILIDFNKTDYLLIKYTSFVKYSRINGKKTKQRIIYVQASKLFVIQLGQRNCINIFIEFFFNTIQLKIPKMCLNGLDRQNLFSYILLGLKRKKVIFYLHYSDDFRTMEIYRIVTVHFRCSDHSLLESDPFYSFAKFVHV